MMGYIRFNGIRRKYGLSEFEEKIEKKKNVFDPIMSAKRYISKVHITIKCLIYFSSLYFCKCIMSPP